MSHPISASGLINSQEIVARLYCNFNYLLFAHIVHIYAIFMPHSEFFAFFVFIEAFSNIYIYIFVSIKLIYRVGSLNSYKSDTEAGEKIWKIHTHKQHTKHSKRFSKGDWESACVCVSLCVYMYECMNEKDNRDRSSGRVKSEEKERELEDTKFHKINTKLKI